MLSTHHHASGSSMNVFGSASSVLLSCRCVLEVRRSNETVKFQGGLRWGNGKFEIGETSNDMRLPNFQSRALRKLSHPGCEEVSRLTASCIRSRDEVGPMGYLNLSHGPALYTTRVAIRDKKVLGLVLPALGLSLF